MILIMVSLWYRKTQKLHLRWKQSLSLLSLGIMLNEYWRFPLKVNCKVNIIPDITGVSFRDHANYSADCRKQQQKYQRLPLFSLNLADIPYLYSALQHPQSSHLFTTSSFVLCTLFNDIPSPLGHTIRAFIEQRVCSLLLRQCERTTLTNSCHFPSTCLQFTNCILIAQSISAFYLPPK